MIADSPTTAAASPGRLVRLGDAVVAVAFLVAILVEIWVVKQVDFPTDVRIGATAVAPFAALPLAARSVRVLPAYVVNAIATCAMVAVGYQSDVYQWANLLLLLAVSISYRTWQSVAALFAGFAGVTYYFLSFEDGELATGILVLAMWFVVWLLGRIQGARNLERELRSDRDIAAELAATRHERLQLEEQRTTMARELHDLIGHTVNVMVVHAGAGRRAVPTDPAMAEQAFATIESTGRSALEELDRVLGILRDDAPDAPLAPLPGVEALPALIEEFRATGLDVDLATSGPVDDVPASVGLTIYRVVQEALTNTMKHGAASQSTVTIDADAREVRALIIDNGIGQTASPTTGGRGLAGITERVQLHGGNATFGPADGSGFRVACTVPLSNASVPS